MLLLATLLNYHYPLNYNRFYSRRESKDGCYFFFLEAAAIFLILSTID